MSLISSTRSLKHKLDSNLPYIVNFKRVSRMSAVQSLYSLIITEDEISTLSEIDLKVLQIYKDTNEMLDTGIELSSKHHYQLIQEIKNNFAEIKGVISDHIKEGWKIDEIHPVMLSILIASVAELIYLDSPVRVVINEFVSMSNEFLPSSEVGFVNSFLDRVARKYAPQGTFSKNPNETQNVPSDDNPSSTEKK